MGTSKCLCYLFICDDFILLTPSDGKDINILVCRWKNYRFPKGAKQLPATLSSILEKSYTNESIDPLAFDQKLKFNPDYLGHPCF